MRVLPCWLLICIISAPVQSEIKKTSSTGFIIQHSINVADDRTAVFQAMTQNIGAWWSPAHSFSGDADTMLLDKNCFCERWEDNLVRHLNTTIWIQNEKVVMHGGLGPLKELGLSGTMTWSLSQAENSMTTISWKYHVFGYSETDLPGLAVAVDGVLEQQINNLVRHLDHSTKNDLPK